MLDLAGEVFGLNLETSEDDEDEESENAVDG